jgi:hypothetical protein
MHHRPQHNLRRCTVSCRLRRHAPHCLAYMAQLRNADIFRFCAIPQVMAIGTLALCYNNHAVFTGAGPPRILPCCPGPSLACLLECFLETIAVLPFSAQASP